MVIKFSYESLTTALTLMSSVTSPKGLQEDLKVMNLYVENGEIKGIATDGKVVCLTKIEGQFDLDGVTEAESFVAIKLKEINDILDKFRGLQRTKVEYVELLVKEHGIVMLVHEEPKDDKGSNADLYRQVSKFMITKHPVKNFIKQELPTLVLDGDAIEVNGVDLQLYLDYFYAPMSKPKDPVTLHFKEDYVCAIMGNIYAVMMENNLPKPLFQDLSLSHTVVGFLKNLIGTEPKFKVHKAVLENGRGILLTFEIGVNTIKVKTNDTTESVNITPFKAVPPNMVVVDKLYLIDALKRIESMDQAFIRVEIKDGDAKMQLSTLKTTQAIPVKCATGEGTYSFMLRPDHISQIIFSHVTKTLDGSTNIDDVHICMQEGSDGKVVQLTCKDISDLWSTKYPRAPIMDTPAIEW